MFHVIWEFVQSEDCVAQTEDAQNAHILQIAQCIYMHVCMCYNIHSSPTKSI